MTEKQLNENISFILIWSGTTPTNSSNLVNLINNNKRFLVHSASAHSTLSNENIENLQNKAKYNDDFEESFAIRSLAGSQLIK